MALEMKVPTVGESINEVSIAEWTKKDGEYVEMDEVICELESDKATFEVNAEASGILHIKAQEGDTLEVGDPICEIEESDQKPDDTGGDKKETADATEKSSSDGDSGGLKKTGEVLEMKVPTVGESINEVTIASWTKSSGDYVELDEVICELESDKATFELNAEAAGILEIVGEEGDTLEIGDLICKIEKTEGKPEASSGGSDKKEEQSAAKPDISSADDKQTYASGHPSPAAAKILSEKGIKPEEVKGTGKDGRITKEDAEKATKPEKKESKPASGGQKEAEQAPKVSGDREVERKKMSNLRKTIARRLVTVKNETAMLTTFNEVDMKPVMDIRKKYKEMFKEKNEVNLGFMSFFTKAVCLALQEWPAVNAIIDGDEVIYHQYCDVSIAVSTPKGLVVPVIRNAEQLSFAQVEKEVIRLALKARDGKLSMDEMQGGTFTITNGGIFGSMLSTPIINAPQSAILGMHNIVERPVAINGQVEIRPIMYTALSYDHRIIDGRESVSFLKRVKELLEDPARLMLEI